MKSIKQCSIQKIQNINKINDWKTDEYYKISIGIYLIHFEYCLHNKTKHSCKEIGHKFYVFVRPPDQILRLILFGYFSL